MAFKGTARSRMNFSLFHMMAAARFARQSGEIEIQHQGEPLGPFYDDISVLVASTIIMASTSLEAFINEVFLNADMYLPSSEAEIKANWPAIEKTEALEKFRTAMEMAGADKMKKGTRVYQNVSALIAMRNALVHFKPEWNDENKGHRKIAKQIYNKFPLSPFWQGDKTFPEKCMSYGCAKWCVESALKFVELFCSETSIENRYLNFMDRLNVSLPTENPQH
jgi:hypothetical protein